MKRSRRTCYRSIFETKKLIAVKRRQFSEAVHHHQPRIMDSVHNTNGCLNTVLVALDLDELRFRDTQVAPHDMILPLA